MGFIILQPNNMPGLSLQQAQSAGFTPNSTPVTSSGNTPSIPTQTGGMTLSQAQSAGFTPTSNPDNSFMGAHPVLKAIGNFTGVNGLAKGLSQAIFLNLTPEGKQTLSDLQSGKITLDQFNNIVGGGLATSQEVLGSAGQTALTLGTAGLGAPEAATANEATGQLIRGGAAEATTAGLGTRVAKAAATGVGIGATGGGLNAVSQGEGAGGIATGALEGAATGGVLGGASELATTGLIKSLGAIRDSVYGTAEQQAAARAAQAPAQLQSVADEWAKPTTVNKSAYSPARAVLAKDPEIPMTLANLGQNPFDHIEVEGGNGVYDTSDSAQEIRDNMGQKSAQLLRPALVMADASTPFTPVAEVIQNSINHVRSNNSLTPDDTESIVNQITQKGEALARKYPEGMKLSDLLDEKITYDQNGGFNPVKSNADNATAIANRAIGDGARTALETNAPAEIGVKDFNGQLAKNYRAADYLDALNGKKAPASLLTKAVRYGSKILGARVGAAFGGDLVTELVGYHVGGALENLIETMTNPMRDAFLDDIKTKVTPEQFSKVSAYMQSVQDKADNSIKLPAGTGVDTRPIILPENKGGESSVTSIPAQKGNPFQNPTTGRMERNYTSDTSNIQYVKDAKTGKVRIIQK